MDGRQTDDGLTDGQTTEPAYIISYPGAIGSGELKKKKEKEKNYGDFDINHIPLKQILI